ncbi:hypothetical protein BDK51DRAFT_51811, partial [Blyttiomyces helicus]
TVKDVNFIGASDDYVVSGSDDGSLLIWSKTTGKLINILRGDEQVVNVIVQNPTLPVLAVSGIDNDVKLFESIYPTSCGTPVDVDRLLRDGPDDDDDHDDHDDGGGTSGGDDEPRRRRRHHRRGRYPEMGSPHRRSNPSLTDPFPPLSTRATPVFPPSSSLLARARAIVNENDQRRSRGLDDHRSRLTVGMLRALMRRMEAAREGAEEMPEGEGCAVQ